MSTQNIRFKAENDRNYNFYWLVDLSIRDTLGLTPAENQSLSALGQVIKHPKIELPKNVIEHMTEFAVTNPVLNFFCEITQFRSLFQAPLPSLCAKAFRTTLVF